MSNTRPGLASCEAEVKEALASLVGMLRDTGFAAVLVLLLTAKGQDVERKLSELMEGHGSAPKLEHD
jgi:hypothetical protein